MSDEVPRPLQNEAIQAQLQIVSSSPLHVARVLIGDQNDLGKDNRDRIFSTDPGHRGVNLRRVFAVRDCNDENSEASQRAHANRVEIAGWFSESIHVCLRDLH